ncbi:MAG: 16S rRNA (adenine(1518)-N(6)/adenine(1519)-N(6))-dimethyltransferase RsmA [bacterium]|nr:16S rRNA (adenine(1518)-N(6)/adenine(1519)-N(6))-dimethyltransferase RsmA [bacterium]
MTRLGQHFLTDKSALKKIAALLDLKEEDTVVEIGPGHGELTEELVFKNQDLRIIAIEKDEQLANDLRSKIYDLGIKNVEVVTGDVLKILPSLIENCELKIENYKLTGNIPYYITGKLLRTISELQEKPEISVFTIQKEVAERLAAKPPRMNRLAASVQFWAEPKIAFIIPRTSFQPIPEVDSATIVLKRGVQRGIKTDAYYKTVRVLFSQPRKTILNNLSFGMGISKKDAEEKLKLAGIESGLRPQNLSVEDIIKIAAVF